MKRIWTCIITFFLMTISVSAMTSNEIVDYAKEQKADVAFYYENLVTGEKISFNESKVFKAASTIKLPLVLYAYELASQDKLKLESKMTYHSNYYYEGSGVIRYEPIGGQYTLRDLAEKSIVHSDNIAYSMLRAKVGEGNFKNYLRSLGGKLVDSSGYKTMNCTDFSKYIKAYYGFTQEHIELGRELTQFWQNTVFNEHIVAGVPNFKVGHKIGWLPMEGLYHDGGVVYHEQPYVLIIMTQGISTTKQKDFFKALTEKINTYHEEQYAIYKKAVFEEYIAMQTLPIRQVAEALEAELIWSPELSQTTLKDGSIEITFDVLNNKCFNKEEIIEKPFIFYQNTIYLYKDFVLEQLYRPLRTVVEEMNGSISWNKATATAECKVEEVIYRFDTMNKKTYRNDAEIQMPFEYIEGILYIPRGATIQGEEIIEEIEETKEEA